MLVLVPQLQLLFALGGYGGIDYEQETWKTVGHPVTSP